MLFSPGKYIKIKKYWFLNSWITHQVWCLKKKKKKGFFLSYVNFAYLFVLFLCSIWDKQWRCGCLNEKFAGQIFTCGKWWCGPFERTSLQLQRERHYRLLCRCFLVLCLRPQIFFIPILSIYIFCKPFLGNYTQLF